MIIEGRAVVIPGDDVDTDVMYPGQFLNIEDPELMKAHLFEGYDPTLRDQLGPDTIIVTGANFGLGSSREHVVQAMKAWGVRCLVGASFARILRRNAVNLGLPVLECARRGRRCAAGLADQGRHRHRRGGRRRPGVPRASGAGVRRRPRVLRRPRAVGEGAARGGVDVIVRDSGDAGRSSSRPTTPTSAGQFATSWADHGAVSASLKIADEAARRRLGGLGARAARGRDGHAGELPRRRCPLAPRLLPRRHRRDHGAGRACGPARVDARRRHLPPALRARSRRSASPARPRRRRRSRRSSPSRRRSSAATRVTTGAEYELLQLFDRLSLYFCMRDVEAGETAELQGYRLEPIAPWHVRCQPVPVRRVARRASPCSGVFCPSRRASEILSGDARARHDHRRGLRATPCPGPRRASGPVRSRPRVRPSNQSISSSSGPLAPSRYRAPPCALPRGRLLLLDESGQSEAHDRPRRLRQVGHPRVVVDAHRHVRIRCDVAEMAAALAERQEEPAVLPDVPDRRHVGPAVLPVRARAVRCASR